MAAATPLLQNFGIRYPIIQAPMLGITTPDMVAAIANAGGLGGGLSPEKARQLIQDTRSNPGNQK